MSDTLMPDVVRMALERYGTQPLKRYWDSDFGPLWLISTWHGTHPPQEVFDEFAPYRVQWAGALRSACQENWLVLIRCDDLDHVANAPAQRDFVRRASQVSSTDPAAIRAGYILGGRIKTLLGQVPGSGWVPKYLPNAAVRLEVASNHRAKFRRLATTPAKFFADANNQVRCYFEENALTTPINASLAVNEISIDPEVVADCRFGDFDVRFEVDDSGSPRLWEVTWAG